MNNYIYSCWYCSIDDTDEKTKRLNENFKEIVRREINATNDRIRTYSERQISNLHAFTKQAESDYNTLLKYVNISYTICK